jgi:hypothetical protein
MNSSQKQIILTPNDAEISKTKVIESYNYNLFNILTGKLSFTGKINSFGGILDFSHLPAGTYILRIEMTNDEIDTHKIVL